MKKQKAVTLIELIVTMTLIMITSLLVLPVWHDKLQYEGMMSHINQLYVSLNYARRQSIARGYTVTVCGSSGLKQCDGQWSAGHIVFVDKDKSGQVKDDFDLLRVKAAPNHYGTWTWKSFQQHPYLQFLPSGFTRRQNGTFIYCPNNGDIKFASALVVSQSGRVRVERDKAKGCA